MLPSRRSRRPSALSVTPEELCISGYRKCRRKNWHDQMTCAKLMIRWRRLRTKARRKSRTCLRPPGRLWSKHEGTACCSIITLKKSRYRSRNKSNRRTHTIQTRPQCREPYCARFTRLEARRDSTFARNCGRLPAVWYVQLFRRFLITSPRTAG